MDLSLIIPTRNRPHHLERLLVSLEGQEGMDGIQWEVTITDDGSGPETREQEREIAARHSGLPLQFILLPGPGNVSRARNEGLRRSTGEIVMFVDGDIRLAPGALRAALRAHRANPHLPVIVGREKKIRNDYWSNYWHYYYNVVFNKAFPCPYAVGMLSPGLCSVKRALADKIHPLFDETLPSREDLDLYMRLRHAGIGVYKEDAIEGFHDSRQGFWPMIRQRLWYEEGEMALWRKYGAARMAAFYKEQPQVPRKWVYAPVNLVFLAARRLWRIYLQAQRPGVRCCL